MAHTNGTPLTSGGFQPMCMGSTRLVKRGAELRQPIPFRAQITDLVINVRSSFPSRRHFYQNINQNGEIIATTDFHSS